MAAETLTSLQNSLTQAYAQRFEEIFVRRVGGASVDSLLDYYRAVGAVGVGQYDVTGVGGGGDKAARVLVKTSTGNTVTPFTSGDPRPAGGQRSDTTAIWDWKNYWTTLHMRGDAYRAATSGARWSMIDAWAEKMEDGFKDIKDQIDADLATATASNRVDSVDSAIGNDVNTYANIDRTVTTAWKPYKKAAGAVAVTKALLDDVDRTLRETRRVNYDHIVCGITQNQKLADIIDGRRRGTPGDAFDIFPGELLYNGRPIIPIGGLTNTKVFFTDSQQWKLRFQEYRAGALNGALQRPVTVDGMPFGLIADDDGSDGVQVTLAVSLNLAYKNTFRAGWLDDLAT